MRKLPRRAPEKIPGKIPKPGKMRTEADRALKKSTMKNLRLPEKTGETAAGPEETKRLQMPMKPDLREGEKIDDLQRDGLSIIQNPGRFCFGIDAVLLSYFARAAGKDKVIDLGTGTGIIPILMSSRTKAEHFTALEIQEESADMAGRSVLLNGLEDRISVVTGDIREAGRMFAPASFDVVTCNPPYMRGGHGLVNPDEPKAVARHEILCTLEDVTAAAAHLLRSRGRFYMVHRPARLGEIFRSLTHHHLEPKRIRLVYPYAGREANMVLIEAVSGAGSGMHVEAPLIVYSAPGVYTDEVMDVYYN